MIAMTTNNSIQREKHNEDASIWTPGCWTLSVRRTRSQNDPEGTVLSYRFDLIRTLPGLARTDASGRVTIFAW